MAAGLVGYGSDDDNDHSTGSDNPVECTGTFDVCTGQRASAPTAPGGTGKDSPHKGWRTIKRPSANLGLCSHKRLKTRPKRRRRLVPTAAKELLPNVKRGARRTPIRLHAGETDRKDKLYAEIANHEENGENRLLPRPDSLASLATSVRLCSWFATLRLLSLRSCRWVQSDWLPLGAPHDGVGQQLICRGWHEPSAPSRFCHQSLARTSC